MGVEFFFFGLGMLAFLYVAYDLKYPNRFVGDMYGLEVMCRLFVLCAATAPMLLGVAFLFVGWRRKMRRLRVLGIAVTGVSSVILMAIALDVAHSRHLNEVRRSYSEKSVEELLAIAKGQKDQYALDAILIRRDPAAVPGLVLILLNESEPGNLRYVAAQALARIGGKDAREALEKAIDLSKDEHFKEFLNRTVQEVRPGVEQPEPLDRKSPGN
jgi:hypothetical protein